MIAAAAFAALRVQESLMRSGWIVDHLAIINATGAIL